MNVAANRSQEPSHGQTDQYTARADHHDPSGRAHERERAGHRGRDGHAVRDDRRRVVDHALALEDRHAAATSGGETTAPSANAEAQGSPGTARCATQATTSVANRTCPTPSDRIGRKL